MLFSFIFKWIFIGSNFIGLLAQRSRLRYSVYFQISAGHRCDSVLGFIVTPLPALVAGPNIFLDSVLPPTPVLLILLCHLLSFLRCLLTVSAYPIQRPLPWQISTLSCSCSLYLLIPVKHIVLYLSLC